MYPVVACSGRTTQAAAARVSPPFLTRYFFLLTSLSLRSLFIGSDCLVTYDKHTLTHRTYRYFLDRLSQCLVGRQSFPIPACGMAAWVP